ncbi:MAG: prepilin peptidase [Chloroflexi bacterium]|nr:prepilin peptidase [Chloroflexota bacterium]
MVIGPLVVLAGVIGLIAGAIVDRVAVRWRPDVAVDEALGVVEGTRDDWLEWLPVLGWLLPALRGDHSTVLVMRAVTEIAGALTFAALVAIDLDPLRLLLRAALIADLLLILRVDWQYHLIQDRAIAVGVVLALASAASQSMAALVGAVAAGLGAAVVFLLLYLLGRRLYGQAALGFGDVLLAGLIGAAVGPAAVVGTLLWGIVLGSLGGVLIALMRRTLRTYIAYGAYLAAVAIGVLALPSLVGGLPGFF